MSERKETSEEIARRVHDTLPSFLVRTPEQVAEDERVQELRRASFTRSKLTEEERLVSRGKQIEEIAKANIETQKQLREEGRNVSTHGGANLEMLEQELIRLSHGLELQGDYEQAVTVHPLKREQTRLKKIVEAIDKPDDKFCKCPPTKTEHDGQAIEIHPHYEVKKIYSRKHGRVVSLVGCSKCPSLNATPTPPKQLTQVLTAHAASSAAAKVNRQVNVRDVHLLGVKQSNS
jgi:hypothetical protein